MASRGFALPTVLCLLSTVHCFALSLGPPVSVCIKADAPDLVQQAATELAQVLREMTGGEATVARVQAASEIDRARPAIVLDSLAADFLN